MKRSCIALFCNQHRFDIVTRTFRQKRPNGPSAYHSKVRRQNGPRLAGTQTTGNEKDGTCRFLHRDTKILLPDDRLRNVLVQLHKLPPTGATLVFGVPAVDNPPRARLAPALDEEMRTPLAYPRADGQEAVPQRRDLVHDRGRDRGEVERRGAQAREQRVFQDEV